MGRGQHHAWHAWIAVGHEACIPHGGVGAHDVARPVQHVLHDPHGSRIVQGGTLDFGTHGGQIAPVQGFQPRTVGRVPHVHGVAQCGDRGARGKGCPLQERGKAIVGIRGGDESGMGHAHLGCEHAGGQIPHVARRHAELCGLTQQIGGPRVVDALRHPTRNVDAVGRRQRALRLQGVVEERRLDHGLTIVKRTLHFQGLDVGPCCGQLLLLNLADSALGIENDNIDVGDIQEPLRHGTARVPACRHQNGQSLVADPTQHTRQETRAHILEGVSGSMEQLQRVDVVLHFVQFQRKVQRVFQNVKQVLMLEVSLGQRRHHGCAKVPGIQILLRKPQLLRQGWNPLGIVQPLVRRQPLHHRLSEAAGQPTVSETVIQHGLLGLKWWSREGDGPCLGQT